MVASFTVITYPGTGSSLGQASGYCDKFLVVLLSIWGSMEIGMQGGRHEDVGSKFHIFILHITPKSYGVQHGRRVRRCPGALAPTEQFLGGTEHPLNRIFFVERL
jgi:hypothetical protein